MAVQQLLQDRLEHRAVRRRQEPQRERFEVDRGVRLAALEFPQRALAGRQGHGSGLAAVLLAQQALELRTLTCLSAVGHPGPPGTSSLLSRAATSSFDISDTLA